MSTRTLKVGGGKKAKNKPFNRKGRRALSLSLGIPFLRNEKR